MVESILNLFEVTAGYDKGLAVVHNFTLGFPKSKITTLIGPNGAGKSTLLRTIVGMTILIEGDILFNAKSILNLEPWERLDLGIGFVPQGRCNFPYMTVRENLDLGVHRVPKSERAARFEEVIDLFPILKNRLGQLAGNMSGGEQQLLEMAMILVRHPHLLLLDEPSLGLSPSAQSQVFEFLKVICRNGISILMVEQNAAAALEISHEAVVLDQGRLFMHNSADKIMTDSRVKDLYLGGSVAQI